MISSPTLIVSYKQHIFTITSFVSPMVVFIDEAKEKPKRIIEDTIAKLGPQIIKSRTTRKILENISREREIPTGDTRVNLKIIFCSDDISLSL